jgi:hypothetical protein
VCVDYKGLNKACPKEPFSLLCIDQVVDSTVGCKLLSFLDVYSGYHQIVMKESYKHATTFITPFWNILLCLHALRFEECWGNISALHALVLHRPSQMQH